MEKKTLSWLSAEPKFPKEIKPDEWTDLRPSRRNKYYTRVLVFNSLRRLRKAYAYIGRVCDAAPKPAINAGAPYAAVFLNSGFEKGTISHEMICILLITRRDLLTPYIYAHELIHMTIAHEIHVFSEGCLDYNDLEREEEFAYQYGEWSRVYQKWASKVQ